MRVVGHVLVRTVRAVELLWRSMPLTQKVPLVRELCYAALPFSVVLGEVGSSRLQQMVATVQHCKRLQRNEDAVDFEHDLLKTNLDCRKITAIAISSPGSINEYLAIDSGEYMNKINSLRAVIAAWPCASQISRIGIGMNRSDRG